jgi:hypothetical protein
MTFLPLCALRGMRGTTWSYDSAGRASRIVGATPRRQNAPRVTPPSIRQDHAMRALRQIALSGFVCAVLAPSALAQTPPPAPAPAPSASSAPTPSPPGAAVYIINPKDGDVLTSPFKVVFGLTAMGVAPAGVEKPNTGHHHLLIDATLSGDELKTAIPSDDKHKHFGGGQTETMLTLPPGQHTLQLVLGDWSHVPHNPPVMSKPITITVVK